MRKIGSSSLMIGASIAAVTAGILVASLAHLGDHGVKMLGEIPF